jgi:single-stranded DNA-binding protein
MNQGDPMNSASITGRIGVIDPLRHMRSGRAHVRMRVASSDYFAGKEHTTWFTVHCYDASAVHASRVLEKGQRVCVQGVLIARTYQNKLDVKITELELHTNQIEFLDRARSNSAGDEASSAMIEGCVLPDLDDDDYILT